MIWKLIKVPERTHQILLLESFRQSLKSGSPVSMGSIVEQQTEKLNKKHKHIKETK